jgi:simple sugar transport system permease protein
MGEMITERSGVLNIGVEGVMLMGALAAALGSYFNGSPWLGLLIAGVVGYVSRLVVLIYRDHTAQQPIHNRLAIYVLCVGLLDIYAAKLSLNMAVILHGEYIAEFAHGFSGKCPGIGSQF